MEDYYAQDRHQGPVRWRSNNSLVEPRGFRTDTLPQIFRSFLSIIGIQIVVLMLILFVPQIMTLFP